MIYSRLVALGSYLPEQILTNHDLARMVETTDEWIVKRVGIKKRHIIAKDQTVAHMATHASKRALDLAKIDPSTMDMIIVGSTTSEFYFPSVACFVQAALNIPGIPAFDICAACSGFIYGLHVANQFIQNGSAKRILVIGADAMSHMMDWSDRSTCVLFGDGAGAAILEAATAPGIISCHVHADGRYQNLLYERANLAHHSEPIRLEMDGSALFKIAVKQLEAVADETLKKNHLSQCDIDWLIPHQANIRIIEATAKRLNMSMEQVILTVENQGNTSAASVPLAMDYALRQGKIKRGDLCLLEAFGAGLAWGSALIRY